MSKTIQAPGSGAKRTSNSGRRHRGGRRGRCARRGGGGWRAWRVWCWRAVAGGEPGGEPGGAGNAARGQSPVRRATARRSAPCDVPFPSPTALADYQLVGRAVKSRWASRFCHCSYRSRSSGGGGSPKWRRPGYLNGVDEENSETAQHAGRRPAADVETERPQAERPQAERPQTERPQTEQPAARSTVAPAFAPPLAAGRLVVRLTPRTRQCVDRVRTVESGPGLEAKDRLPVDQLSGAGRDAALSVIAGGRRGPAHAR